MLWYFSQFHTPCDVFFYLSRVGVDNIDGALCMQSHRYKLMKNFSLLSIVCSRRPSYRHFIIACLSSFLRSTMKLLLTYPVEMSSKWMKRERERWEKLDEEMRVTLMGLSSWLNYFNSSTLTLEISGELMIVRLECEYFGCFAFIVTNKQIRSASDKHVTDTSSLHLGSFVKRCLSSLVVQHVDNGVGRKCDQKFHHILMSTTWRMMKCRPAHRINREQWIALQMELFQLNGREMRWE